MFTNHLFLLRIITNLFHWVILNNHSFLFLLQLLLTTSDLRFEGPTFAAAMVVRLGNLPNDALPNAAIAVSTTEHK